MAWDPVRASRHGLRVLRGVALGMLFAVPIASAQYPNRAVKIIVGLSVGGAPDIVLVKLIGAKLDK